MVDIDFYALATFEEVDLEEGGVGSILLEGRDSLPEDTRQMGQAGHRGKEVAIAQIPLLHVLRLEPKSDHQILNDGVDRGSISEQAVFPTAGFTLEC